MEPVKILVVDDEPDQGELIKKLFRKRIQAGDLVVMTAVHGEEALQQILDHPEITIVLLDIRMPKMDGLTLLKHLQDRDLRVCVIMVTAFNDMYSIRTAMNRGAYDFLTKPLDRRDLSITLEKAIEFIRKRRRREQAVQASERAYRLFAEKTADGLAIIQERKIIVVNPALCSILEKSEEQLLGTSFDDLLDAPLIIAERTDPGQPGADNPAAQAHSANWQGRRISLENRERWVEICCEPIEWQARPACLATVRDVSFRQQNEGRMRV